MHYIRQRKKGETGKAQSLKSDGSDGLTKYQRYRLKDLDQYRERKRELATTAKHRETRRAYMKKWREENRDRHNQLARESHQRNKHKHVGKMRAYHLRRKYGLSQEDYDAMLLSQNGKCKICGKNQSESVRMFHVDHDHSTGDVRGILCNRCNTSLGWYEKHREGIESYL
jgi:transposase InsO family protein